MLLKMFEVLIEMCFKNLVLFFKDFKLKFWQIHFKRKKREL